MQRFVSIRPWRLAPLVAAGLLALAAPARADLILMTFEGPATLRDCFGGFCSTSDSWLYLTFVVDFDRNPDGTPRDGPEFYVAAGPGGSGSVPDPGPGWLVEQSGSDTYMSLYSSSVFQHPYITHARYELIASVSGGSSSDWVVGALFFGQYRFYLNPGHYGGDLTELREMSGQLTLTDMHAVPEPDVALMMLAGLGLLALRWPFRHSV